MFSSRRLELANILSEWLRNPAKRVAYPRTPAPLEAWAFGARLENRSVFILDPRLPFVFTVEPQFNESLYNDVYWTIFFSPAKITVKCREQNLDLTKSRPYKEHNLQVNVKYTSISQIN